jgi:hypothetical protein
MIGFQISAIISIAAYNLLKFSGLQVIMTILQTPIITVQTVQGGELLLAIDVACSGQGILLHLHLLYALRQGQVHKGRPRAAYEALLFLV